ncbi:immunoglobulin domain-containing protein [Runella sp.]|uniref:immunoglobulin domain-containing protein n=1 Tax=Runella sp. TaxID=1960881 RepID=UPI003D10D489
MLFYVVEKALAQTCTGTLGSPVVNITFGTGTGFTTLAAAAPGATTTYNPISADCPEDGQYTVADSTHNCFYGSWFIVSEDHTPNDVNGRMAVFNASYGSGEFYRQTISGLCGNTTYEVAAWMANILKTTGCSGNGIDPNITLQIESLDGTLLQTYTTGDIAETNAFIWKQYAFLFTTGAGQTEVVLKIINDAPGGCGNDLLLDDITLRPCDSFTITGLPTSCDGLTARQDGKLQINNVPAGRRYDFSVGTNYTGNQTFATATVIPPNGILADTLSNPAVSQEYTVRLFESTGCVSDRSVTLLHRECICPIPPFVVPESQSVCEGDTLRTIHGFVEPGVTIDWYDEQGNLLKQGSLFFKPTQAGAVYAEARNIATNCKGVSRVPSYAFINTLPSFRGVVTGGTCIGASVVADAKITLLDVQNGSRYDYTKGVQYLGNKTYDTATDIAANGIILENLVNPLTTDFYTVRVFGATGCFKDTVLKFEPTICECPHPPTVVPESQSVCTGDTLRTIHSFVNLGTIVDWYDAPVGGNLLKQNSLFFKPTQAGIVYAEARDLITGCKSGTRVPSYAFVNPLPEFVLESKTPSCFQNNPQNDASIKLKANRYGTKYDYSIGEKYIGQRTFDDALALPTDSILVKNIVNPSSSQKYTIRIFSDSNCFKDETITLNRFECNCVPITVNVTTQNTVVCRGDTLPTIMASVGADNTVDWYDASTNGKVVKANSISFKPPHLGTYYAEGKSLLNVGCVSSVRVPVTFQASYAPKCIQFQLKKNPK